MAKRQAADAKLDMTPMIDVVFQLIIFFVVTMKQEDILSHLDAMSPAPDPNATPENKIDLIEIDIYNPRQGGCGFLFNKKPVTSLADLDAKMKYYAKFTKKDSTIMIRCTKDSPHALLIQAMDICNKYEMTNLALFSL